MNTYGDNYPERSRRLYSRPDNIMNLNRFVHFIYDPTNGSMSRGEIFRPGGEPDGDTAAVARFVEGRR